MNSTISKGLIKTNPKKKIWYVDNDQYLFTGNKICYKDQTKYNIQIEKITKQGSQYVLNLPKTNCAGHLGFEIYENNKLIDFTYEYTYTDKNTYSAGYIPKYKIVAYDRELYASKASNVKSYTASSFLKFMNLNNLLYE